MTLDTRRFGDPAPAVPQPESGARGVRQILGDLFPVPAEAPARTRGSRTLSVVLQVAAVGIGTVLLLLRVPGIPSWDSIYAEDYWRFLTQALQQPWHLFIADNGYWELLPRLIAQFVIYLPLAQASRAFAVSGAIIAACCALFVFHASAGHIRSVKLRALLGAALVLLPIAPMEIVDSGVNSIWYLLPVSLWAVLWRPRTRTGMALAAVIAFTSAASNTLCFLLAPLLVARVYVLRRPREHAVTVGWLAGCLAQLPFIVSSYLSGKSRLAQSPVPPRLSLAFYGHDVVLPSLGWHLSWWLRSFAGINGATVIMAAVLVVVFGTILATQVESRAFVVTALLAGLVFAVFGATLTRPAATQTVTFHYESGARYTVLPIFLMEAAAIVGMDCALRRRRGHRRPHRRPGMATRPAVAATALIAVLAASWVADFRYQGIRSVASWNASSWNWGPIAAKWQHDCERSRSGEIVEKTAAVMTTLPCARIGP
jgi:hypothetical protein